MVNLLDSDASERVGEPRQPIGSDESRGVRPSGVANRFAARRIPPSEFLSISGLLGISALLNLWALTSVGWGNAYYSAAARSMGSSWKSFFFASLDSSNFVSVDKPPFSLWVQVLSSKIFGYSQFSLLLPEALAGIAGVLLLYVGIRRSWGHRAGLAAGGALAVTPIFVAVNHTNVMDSVLVFVMTAAAVTTLEAVRRGQLRWLLLACVIGGCAITAKMAAGVPVLPGIVVAYLWCAPRSWRTRLWHGGLAVAVLAVSSLWWFVAVWATPADSRPYVGSTQKNSVFELAVERNGVNQVEGGTGLGGGGGPGGFGGRRGTTNLPNTPNTPNTPNPGAAAPGNGTTNALPGFPAFPVAPTPGTPTPVTPTPVTPGATGNGTQGGLFPPGVPVPNLGNGTTGGLPGGGFPGGFGPNGRGFPGGRGGAGGPFGIGFSGGVAGPLRLVNSDLGTQIGWLLPVALLGGLAGLILVGWRGSHKLSALVVFGGWLAGAGGVFSITKGIVHPYYVSQLAPPVAALFGIGVGAVTATLKGTVSSSLSESTDVTESAAPVGPSAQTEVAEGTEGTDLFNPIRPSGPLVNRVIPLLFICGLVATAYTQWVILRRVDWRSWLAPVAATMIAVAAIATLVTVVVRRSHRLSTATSAFAVVATLVAPLLWTQGSLAAGVSGNLPYANPLAVSSGGRVAGGIAPNGGTTFTTAATDPLVRYLRSQRTTEKWILAVPSAGSAEPLIINTGEPVMALGGFIGSDPIVTDEQLATLVADGDVRFFLASQSTGGFGGGGGPFGSGSHADWITSNCVLVDESLWTDGSATTGTSDANDATAGRAFPGGPTAGNYSLYDCKKA